MKSQYTGDFKHERRTSSAHIDLVLPFGGRNDPDYVPGKYPERQTGGETVIMRFQQFGITEKEMRQYLGTTDPKIIAKITEGQYDRIVAQAFRLQCDTLFATAFGDSVARIQKENVAVQDLKRMIERAVSRYGGYGFIIKRAEDAQKDEPKILISLEEPLSHLRTIKDIKEMIEFGIRAFSLQYSTVKADENALAGKDGLTTFGQKAVKFLLKQGIIVDIAHSIWKVRKQVMDIAEDLDSGSLLCYSHGAPTFDIAKDSRYGTKLAVPRGIRDDEIRRLLKLHGLIGLGVTKPFFQSTEHMVEAMDRILQFEHGPTNLVIGSDFGGVWSDLLFGINSVKDMWKIGEALAKRFGYKDVQIKQILRRNLPEWVAKSGLGEGVDQE